MATSGNSTLSASTRTAVSVTHVLVKEGHLWAHKDVAIPFGMVAGFDDGIRLSITRQQVRDLPPADIDPAAG